MSNCRMNVYVASPLGYSDATRAWYQNTLLPAIAGTGVEVLDPWDEAWRPVLDPLPAIPSQAEYVSAWGDLNRRIGARNTQRIHQAHGVVAVLDGPDVDSGVAAEIGYATGLGRWVLGFRSNTRSRGDNPGCLVNLQVEHFIRTRGEIYTALDSLLVDLQARVSAFNASVSG